jgi:iron complex outermembrane recepter protein
MTRCQKFVRGFGRFTAAAAVSVAAGSIVAQAQEQPAQASTQPLQTVVVTGSYIPRIDKESPSPVTTISADDIANSGFTTVADIVRTVAADNSGTLPTAFAGAFAAGASGIALRGLTVNSTLVLIDGLRAADYALPDDGVRSFVDLNSIPVGTIERIEVLRDGASSVYGADAIGGVVNVILRKQYQGFNGSAQIGDSQHGGGFQRHLDFTAGLGDLAADHYNAYLSAEWQADNRIGVGQRGFPFNDNNYTSFGGANLHQQPGIGSGSIYGSVTPATLGTPGNVLTGVALPGAVAQPLRPCPASAPQAVDAGGNAFCDQNQVGYLDDQPPTQRFGLSGRVTVQFNDKTLGYLHASYYQNESVFPSLPPAQIQTTTPNLTTTIALPATIPGPLNPGTACGTAVIPGVCILNPNNPFAAQGNAALINYAFGPLGPLSSAIKNHNLRVVADLSGSWAGWNYDDAFVINHTWLDYSIIGNLNFSQLVTDVTNGTYNFINPSANSPAVLGALAPRVTNNDSSDMDTIVLRGNRALTELPGGPLGIALGAEWRYEAEVDLNFNSPPPEVQQIGFSQAIGSRHIESFSAELDAPVLKQLEFNVSGRFDHYSDFGNATTPKVGFKFKPLDQVALRGTYSQGFRAPSFAENGSAEVEGFIPGFGFCPSNLCTAHGADGYISSYTLGELTTANPTIQPEKSRSYTVGLLLQPAQSFSAAFDYYYIKKTNLITGPNQSAALAQYAANGTLPGGFSAIYDNPDPLFPAALPRIVTIAGPYINAATEYTDGVDIDLTGHFNLGSLGRLTSDLSGTRILSFVYEQAGQPNLQYAGFQSPYNLSSGAGTPKDRVTWTNTWQKGPVTLAADVYYVSDYKLYGQDLFGVGANSQVQYVCLTTIINGVSPAAAGNCRTASFTYLNLTGSYQVSAQWQLFGSVDNVLDKLPPVNLPSYNGANYNATYSQAGIVGRFFRIGVRFTL